MKINAGRKIYSVLNTTHYENKKRKRIRRRRLKWFFQHLWTANYDILFVFQTGITGKQTLLSSLWNSYKYNIINKHTNKMRHINFTNIYKEIYCWLIMWTPKAFTPCCFEQWNTFDFDLDRWVMVVKLRGKFWRLSNYKKWKSFFRWNSYVYFFFNKKCQLLQLLQYTNNFIYSKHIKINKINKLRTNQQKSKQNHNR